MHTLAVTQIWPHMHIGASTQKHRPVHTKGGWGSEWLWRSEGRGGIIRLGAQPNGQSGVLSVSALDQSVPLVIDWQWT